MIWAEHDLNLECWYYRYIPTPLSLIWLTVKKSMSVSHAQYYFQIFVLQSHTNGLHFIFAGLFMFYQAHNTTGHCLQHPSKTEDWGRQQGVLWLREKILKCWLECVWYNFPPTIKQNIINNGNSKTQNYKLSTVSYLDWINEMTTVSDMA